MQPEKNDKIRAHAEQMYRDGEFYCSEAVVKAVLEGFGEQVSHSTLAMSSGFPVGIGGAECLCGALGGGVMAIGYFFGRSEAKGGEVAQAMRLSNQLHKQFIARNRTTCCRALTKGLAKGSPDHLLQCVRITGDVAQDVAQIVAENLKK